MLPRVVFSCFLLCVQGQGPTRKNNCSEHPKNYNTREPKSLCAREQPHDEAWATRSKANPQSRTRHALTCKSEIFLQGIFRPSETGPEEVPWKPIPTKPGG